MNSKLIGTCEECGQMYCMECSDAKKYDKFCSKNCEEKNEKEQTNIEEKDKTTKV